MGASVNNNATISHEAQYNCRVCIRACEPATTTAPVTIPVVKGETTEATEARFREAAKKLNGRSGGGCHAWHFSSFAPNARQMIEGRTTPLGAQKPTDTGPTAITQATQTSDPCLDGRWKTGFGSICNK